MHVRAHVVLHAGEKPMTNHELYLAKSEKYSLDSAPGEDKCYGNHLVQCIRIRYI